MRPASLFIGRQLCLLGKSSSLKVPVVTIPGCVNYASTLGAEQRRATVMGACGSCLRMMLDAESDVKIHVIEPTSIAGAEHSVVMQPRPARENSAGPRLQVPNPHPLRPPSPTM